MICILVTVFPERGVIPASHSSAGTSIRHVWSIGFFGRFLRGFVGTKHRAPDRSRSDEEKAPLRRGIQSRYRKVDETMLHMSGPSNVCRLFHAAVDAHPHRVSVECTGESWNYSRLHQRQAQWRAALLGMGVGRDSASGSRSADHVTFRRSFWASSPSVRSLFP